MKMKIDMVRIVALLAFFMSILALIGLFALDMRIDKAESIIGQCE